MVRAYQEACAAVIARYDGHIAQYLGDGLLVYFGYPVGARGRCRSGRCAPGSGSSRRSATLNARLQPSRRSRWPSASASTPAGRGRRDRRRRAGTSELALGETPNLAARLQALAEPDTRGDQCGDPSAPRGAPSPATTSAPTLLKGIAEPLRVYRVLRRRGCAESPGRRPRERGSPRWWAASRRWRCCSTAGRRSKEGRARWCCSAAKPGIGKSRLVRVLREQIAADAAHAGSSAAARPTTSTARSTR